MYPPRLDHVFTMRPDLRHEQLGELVLTTGAIVACDPFVPYAREPFVRRVPPGRYPVHLTLVFWDQSWRVAAASIVLDPSAPVTFEPALRAGERVADLGPDESFGYGVDSGTGGFMDAEVFPAYERMLSELHDRGRADAELIDRFDQHLLVTVPGHSANVAAFQSGWGDGVYATWFGLDAAGEVVCVTTDFELIEDPNAPRPAPAPPPKPKPWWRFW